MSLSKVSSLLSEQFQEGWSVHSMSTGQGDHRARWPPMAPTRLIFSLPFSDLCWVLFPASGRWMASLLAALNNKSRSSSGDELFPQVTSRPVIHHA